MAASKVRKFMDSYIHDSGGVLLERNGKICKGMRKEFNQLKRLHGDKELIDLHNENRTYHFWMQADQGKSYSLHGLGQTYAHPYTGNARQEKNP